MAHFRIINITDKLGKRHVNYKSTLTIEYPDGFYKKTKALGVGQELVLEASSLPPSLHTLRSKKLVNVIKISKNQQESILNPPKPKPVVVVEAVEKEPVVEEVVEQKQKRTRKKKTETIQTEE